MKSSLNKVTITLIVLRLVLTFTGVFLGLSIYADSIKTVRDKNLSIQTKDFTIKFLNEENRDLEEKINRLDYELTKYGAREQADPLNVIFEDAYVKRLCGEYNETLKY